MFDPNPNSNPLTRTLIPTLTLALTQASMLDLFLAAKLLDALPSHTCVLLVRRPRPPLPSHGPVRDKTTRLQTIIAASFWPL